MRNDMSFFPDDFTFGDNSTLTSFTDLRDNPKPGSCYLGVGGSRSTTTGRRRVVEMADRRSEIDEEDKENLERMPFRSSSSSSYSSNEFWATLSVHAASAVMSDGWTLDGDKGDDVLRQAAASAAASSLLEDGREMERINAARIKRRGGGGMYISTKASGSTKPLMRITHQTVRNAATKASIAVLRSGAPQEVAAAVAGAILKEGGKMLKGEKVMDSVSSVSTEKTNNTSGSCYNKTDGSSHSSPSRSSPQKSCSAGCKSRSSSISGSIRHFALPNSRSSVSKPKLNNATNKDTEEIPEGGELGQWQEEDKWKKQDDMTIQSVSISKFGMGDKYATDSQSATSGERDMAGESKSFVGTILGSNKSTVSPVHDRANDNVEEDRDTAKTNKNPTIEEALGDALVAALAIMERNRDSPINYPSPPSLVTSSSGFMQGSTGHSSAATARPRQETESVTTTSSTKEGHSSLESAEQQPSKDHEAVAGEILENASRKEPSPDNRLQQIHSNPSGILSVSSSMAASLEEKFYQQSYELEKGAQALRTAEQLRQLEEQEFERREVKIFIAMEVLRQKLDELHAAKQGIRQQGERPTMQPPPQLSQEQIQTLHLVATEIAAARHMLKGPACSHPCQIEQLSMIATPSMNSSNIIKNPSSCTNPPMPLTDTFLTVDTNHHRYCGDISPASKINESGSTGTSSARWRPPPPTLDAGSAASSIHGRYSVPSNSMSLLTATESSSSSSNRCDGSVKQAVYTPPSSPSARSVLKKPSKCYPIIEIGDEDFAMMEEAEWDETGTVHASVGECRIRTLNDASNGSIEMDARGYGMAENDTIGCCPEIVHGAQSSDSKSSASANHKEKGGDSNLSKEAIEVVLATVPTSPSTKLKGKFNGFFRRNRQKKVTFDISSSNGRSSELLPSQRQQACPQMSEGSWNDPTCGEPAICGPSSSSPTAAAPECVNTTSGHRGSHLRDSIFKRLQRGLLLKSARRRGRRRGRGPMGSGRGRGLATAIKESVQEAERNGTCTSGGPGCGEVMYEKGFVGSRHVVEGIVPKYVEKEEGVTPRLSVNEQVGKNDDSSVAAAQLVDDAATHSTTDLMGGLLDNAQTESSSCLLNAMPKDKIVSEDEAAVPVPATRPKCKDGAESICLNASFDEGSNSHSNPGSTLGPYPGTSACSHPSSRSSRSNKHNSINNSTSKNKPNTPPHENPMASVVSYQNSSHSIGAVSTETWVDKMLGKFARQGFVSDDETLGSSADRSLARYNFI